MRRSRPSRAAQIAATALLLAFGLGACGEDEQSSEPTRADFQRIVSQAQADVYARDYAGVCRALARGARDQIGTAGHRAPTTCQRDARRFFEPMVKRMLARATPEVTAISVDGPRATATVTTEGDFSLVAPFVKESGRWKLASVAGVGRLNTPTTVEAVDIPSKARPVKVTHVVGGKRVPCPKLSPVARAGDPPVSGGCKLEGLSADVELAVVSIFGRSLFAHCKSDLALRIDRDGRTAVTSFGFSGGVGCAEMEPCHQSVQGNQPGQGQLYPADDQPQLDDAYYSRATVCLDNCVGRFAGDLKLAILRDDDRGWRVTGTRGRDERLGFGLTGNWKLSDKSLEIRPAGTKA